nr:DNA mismatch repair protein MSH4-like isoform X2 [Populus alba]
MAGFDLRSASLHLSQYSETSSSYQNTKSLLQFYDPVVVVVPPNKYAPDGLVGISELVLMACGCFDDTKLQSSVTVFSIFFIHYSASKRKFQPQHTQDRSREGSHRHQPPIVVNLVESDDLVISRL